MKIRFCFLIFLGIAVLIASAKKTKKEGNKDKNPGQSKKSLQSFSSCLGQPVNLNVTSGSVEECLTAKYNEIVATLGNSTDEKSVRKLAKKKQKLSKKLNKKCMTECEWKVIGLISSGSNSTGNTSSTSNDSGVEKFSKMFPEQVQDKIKNDLESCLSTEKTTEIREGENINKAKQMCSQNRRITKCFQRSINRACKGKGVLQGTTSTSVPAVSPQSSSPSFNSPLVSNSTAGPAQDDENNEEEKEDDDNDDDKDDDDDNEPTKSSPPSASLNTATPLTK